MVAAECCIIIPQFIRPLNRQMPPPSNKFHGLRHQSALLLRKPERFSVLMVCWKYCMCECTHMVNASFLPFLPFLPLLTRLAWSPRHMFPDGPPSSIALLFPLLPLTLPPPPPTLPSGVLSCLKRNTSWLCMKSKREREIKGNFGDKALKRLRPARCYLLEGVWLQLATFLEQGRLREGQEDREWAARCRSKGDQVSDLQGSICCYCSWAPPTMTTTTTPPPSPRIWLKDCRRWGELC